MPASTVSVLTGGDTIEITHACIQPLARARDIHTHHDDAGVRGLHAGWRVL